ncbi:MAG: hypothetical protein ACRC5H_06185 [Treponemataceae bacterium]
MKILEIRNINRDQVPLYYRMMYTALAVIEIPLKVVEMPFTFIIETDPIGQKTITVSLNESIDYPLLPVLKGLKAMVTQIESEGIPL